MEKEVITIYCIVNDTLKIVGIKDDPQAKMSSSEILTTAVISCIYFGGNFRSTPNFPGFVMYVKAPKLNACMVVVAFSVVWELMIITLFGFYLL